MNAESWTAVPFKKPTALLKNSNSVSQKVDGPDFLRADLSGRPLSPEFWTIHPTSSNLLFTINSISIREVKTKSILKKCFPGKIQHPMEKKGDFPTLPSMCIEDL
jgi:hypothetical protein